MKEDFWLEFDNACALPVTNWMFPQEKREEKIVSRENAVETSSGIKIFRPPRKVKERDGTEINYIGSGRHQLFVQKSNGATTFGPPSTKAFNR